jgi:hypothetical protein
MKKTTKRSAATTLDPMQLAAILRVAKRLEDGLEKSAARAGREGGVMLAHAASEWSRATGVALLAQAIEAELSEEP